ncbi:MAG TPA: bifunctional precorrin-2 dehydrogenase/sirohydrochlorin ferrochelatase [Caulobacteraceae bacterium]|nr:bifunctional precorrin-2 dehydrogenase/sirohydrochlorin ferrochelatase [Caulobacteraceae bacterium]
MDAFPAFFPLAGRTIAIVGDGDAADAKVRLFDGSPARLVRIEDARAHEAAAYDGATLAFICGGDEAFRAQAAAAARAAGAVVNVVDHPALSDFMTPALVDRGQVVAAVGTTGAAPLLATLLRSDIEARVPEGAGRIAALFGALRQKTREALPNLDERRAFLREALVGPAADAAMAGDMAGARRLLEEALAGAAKGERRAGRLRIVMDGGHGDLISLRAARALAQADVLVVGEGAAAATIALARREARRLTPKEAGAKALAKILAQGLDVVWVSAHEPALAPQGADIEVERLWPALG